VKVNKNTIDDAAAIAGRSRGSVTLRNTFHSLAPNTRPASWRSGSSRDQSAPTVRTTTATLKKTWAARIAPIESRQPRATNAVPTTTVGRTNGTVTRAVAKRLPRNSKWDTAQVMGAAVRTVSSVDTVACHRVNHAILTSLAATLLVPMLNSDSPSMRIRATG
jgi:hypothetical protein